MSISLSIFLNKKTSSVILSFIMAKKMVNLDLFVAAEKLK